MTCWSTAQCGPHWNMYLQRCLWPMRQPQPGAGDTSLMTSIVAPRILPVLDRGRDCGMHAKALRCMREVCCLHQVSGTDPKRPPEAAGAPKAAEEAPKRLGVLLGPPKGLGLAPKLKAFELGAPKGPARCKI